MKQIIKITGILLLLILAGNVNLQAQRGMRGMRDTTRMVRPGMRNDIRQQPLPPRFNNRPMYGWGRRIGPMGWQGHNNFMRPGMRGYGPGPGRMQQFGPAFRPQQPGRGFNAVDNIPGLTEKQKNEIAALQKKQQEEMKALRDEAAGKMQSLRENHRKNIMNLLNDEQKKFVESRQGNRNDTPSTNK